jgi:hAT family C-terminal dimerisation region/Domain of unknown function (DUF4413)
LDLFKELTLLMSKTTELMMSQAALLFDMLFVDIDKFKNKTSISTNLKHAANAAYAKLTKYYNKMALESYSIAIVLDPRLKLDIYAKTQDPAFYSTKAKENVTKVFAVYNSRFNGGKTTAPTLQTQTQKRKASIFDYEEENKSELDIYLLEGRVKVDIADYWRMNKGRFPVLYQMAKDYLILQPTSKDAEGVFSMARRYLPYYRMSQNAETIKFQMLVNSGVKLKLF